MNLKQTIRRILKEEFDEKIQSYLDVSPFYKLQYPYQKSLIIFRDEETEDDKIKEIINNQFTKNQKRKIYYFGIVPIKLIQDEVIKRLDWDSFENYHKWYGDENTDHGDSVLPIIIDFDDEELIVDGWHRFHSYVRKGLDQIPVVGIYRD